MGDTAPPAAAAAAVEAAVEAPPYPASEGRAAAARRLVAEVRAALAAGESRSELRGRASWWARAFPSLLNKLLEEDAPVAGESVRAAVARRQAREAQTAAVVEALLAQLDAVERGATSQHDASVAVGGVLVDRFIKPQMAAAGVLGGGRR
jgi:hypothetical protein